MAALITIMAAGCGGDKKETTPVSTKDTQVETETVTTAVTTEEAATKTAEADTMVTTADGPVQGVKEGEILTWYGIPYGKAPVGELRWQAPVKPDSWTEPLKCDKASEPAIQLSGTEVTGREV